MKTVQTGGSTLETIWRERARWSEVGNQLKKAITAARALALLLGIIGAILATLAAQLPADMRGVAQALSIAGAVVLAGIPFVAKGFAPTKLQNWIRARSISEALKKEVFFYLTRTGLYATDEPHVSLARRAQEIVVKVKDLVDLNVQAASVEVGSDPPPIIQSPNDYVEQRVTQQIDRFYLPTARALAQRLRICQIAAGTLTTLGALFGAIGGFSKPEWLGAWVAVATTVAGAIAAYAAANRYEHNVVSYFSTARQLELLRAQFQDAVVSGKAGGDVFAEFVRRCETVISIENQAWMADWQNLQDFQPKETQPRAGAPS